jgi:hypothetical protein
MKAKDYINNLVQMLVKDPEIGELEIIYSHDDEGNTYQKVNFHASLVKTKGLQNQYVDVIIEVDSDEIDKERTALCIN